MSTRHRAAPHFLIRSIDRIVTVCIAATSPFAIPFSLTLSWSPKSRARIRKSSWPRQNCRNDRHGSIGLVRPNAGLVYTATAQGYLQEAQFYSQEGIQAQMTTQCRPVGRWSGQFDRVDHHTGQFASQAPSWYHSQVSIGPSDCASY